VSRVTGSLAFSRRTYAASPPFPRARRRKKATWPGPRDATSPGAAPAYVRGGRARKGPRGFEPPRFRAAGGSLPPRVVRNVPRAPIRHRSSTRRGSHSRSGLTDVRAATDGEDCASVRRSRGDQTVCQRVVAPKACSRATCLRSRARGSRRRSGDGQIMPAGPDRGGGGQRPDGRREAYPLPCTPPWTGVPLSSSVGK
jgi:hypothetical protein